MKKKPRIPRPLVNTLDAITPLSASEVMTAELSLLSSLDSIARGNHPGRQEWDDLADVVNIIETLQVQQRLFVQTSVIDTAERGMREAASRYREGKPLRLNGPALQAMRELCGTWTYCLRTWSKRAIRKAQDDTAQRVREGVRSGQCTVVEIV